MNYRGDEHVYLIHKQYVYDEFIEYKMEVEIKHAKKINQFDMIEYVRILESVPNIPKIEYDSISKVIPPYDI